MTARCVLINTFIQKAFVPLGNKLVVNYNLKTNVVYLPLQPNQDIHLSLHYLWYNQAEILSPMSFLLKLTTLEDKEIERISTSKALITFSVSLAEKLT